MASGSSFEPNSSRELTGLKRLKMISGIVAGGKGFILSFT